VIVALLLAAAIPQTAVDAELAFAKAARGEGQWTAFRRFAAPDAVMFVPDVVKAQEWLRGRDDPATATRWQPAVSYVSCDGHWAVNSGGWQRPDGTTGYFTTIWHRGTRHWRWVFDHGDTTAAARIIPPKPAVRHAACSGKDAHTFGVDADAGFGSSGDQTLRWRWNVTYTKGRTLSVELWDGDQYQRVINDVVAPPK